MGEVQSVKTQLRLSEQFQPTPMHPLKTALALAIVATTLLALDGCRKEKSKRYTGTIVDATTDEPIAEATVYLTKLNSGCFSCPVGEATAKVVTGADGRFDFGEDDSKEATELWAYAYKYIRMTGGHGIYAGEPTTLRLMPESYLRVHLKDEAPFFEGSLAVTYSSVGGGQKSFEIARGLDTVIVGVTEGNKSFTLNWVKTAPSIPVDSPIIEKRIIYMPRFDTVNTQIIF